MKTLVFDIENVFIRKIDINDIEEINKIKTLRNEIE